LGSPSIALQPYAEVNLLDVIVFASLTRIVPQDYWAPDVFGLEKGETLIKEAVRLENQTWNLSETNFVGQFAYCCSSHGVSGRTLPVGSSRFTLTKPPG